MTWTGMISKENIILLTGNSITQLLATCPIMGLTTQNLMVHHLPPKDHLLRKLGHSLLMKESRQHLNLEGLLPHWTTQVNYPRLLPRMHLAPKELDTMSVADAHLTLPRLLHRRNLAHTWLGMKSAAVGRLTHLPALLNLKAPTFRSTGPSFTRRTPSASTEGSTGAGDVLGLLGQNPENLATPVLLLAYPQ